MADGCNTEGLIVALLITKTHFSTPSPNLVDRTRLLNNLDSLLMPGRQVALVSAPAGFGKTTMLTQWLQTVPDPFFVCWLSLDMSDNHLIRFFSYVVAVLQKADPKIGDNFSALVETHPELTADEIVTYIINQVASSSQNILLVIDDTHVISTMEIHRAIEMLVNYMPSNLRLVLAGRIDPVLPLARLRARGQLVEVRTADLRFNVEETSVFLDQFAGLSSMAASLKNALNLSIEGWVAGLQMMVIALRAELRAHGGQPAEVLDLLVSELSGSHRYILDYLLDEVLNRAEPGVREFLLQTCILERFNADLCAAICTEQTSAAEAQSMLANLERANLFIVPLDNQREWYRYHHLFADVLQKQLLHAHPGLAPSLHRRAVDWFEKHGMLDEAIAHAHHSGDAALLFSLVENYALETILRGQITTAIRWLDSLSKEMLMSSTRLCLDCAWALTFTSQTEAAVPYLERATALLQERPNQAMLIRSEILGLQSYRENTYGRANEAVRLARLALENSPEDQPFLQCSNHLFLAGGLARLGQLEEALAEYNIIQSLYQNRENLAGLALLEADFLHYIAMHLKCSRCNGTS